MLIFITYNRKRYDIAEDDRGWVSKKCWYRVFHAGIKIDTCKNPWFMVYYRQITEMRTRLGINFFRDGIILGINFFWEIFLCTLHNKNVKSKSQSRFQRFVKNLTKRSYAGLVGIILGINFFKCWYREFEKNSVFLL